MVHKAPRLNSHRRLRSRVAGLAFLAAWAAPGVAQNPATIEQVKPSIVAVGTFQRSRNPQFTFSGTGFAVGNGLLIATNEHVVAKALDSQHNEALAIAVRMQDAVAVRSARKIASDPAADVALLRIDGTPLPALRLGDAGRVREGEVYLFTGFPIGAVLGLSPVTHRAMISAITPIVIPPARADQLDARSVRRLQAGAYSVFQLDGTAYPGNSGSPLYHAESGEVVGVVNSVFVKGTKEAALAQPSGITYAIPVEALKSLLKSVQQ